MNGIRSAIIRIGSLFRKEEMECDLDTELASHLEMHVADNLRAGMTEEEARRDALIKLGGVEQTKEKYREQSGIAWIETLVQDLRFGARMLWKDPGFTVIAILTLALGIGANTSIFTVVNTMLFQPLPVRAGNRLVVIWVNNMEHGWNRIGPSGLDYLDWKEQNKSFEDLFLFEHGTGTVTGQGEPEQIAGWRVTTNFGEFFGIMPALGRTFLPEEANGKHNSMILANRYWRQHFNSDPSAVGRVMTLNGEPYTIIGVLPQEVNTFFPVDVVVPFDNEWVKRVDSNLGVYGRRKEEVTLKQASSEMGVLMDGIGTRRPSRKGYGAVLVPLESARVEYIRPALLVLLGAVVFVLLIVCANVANLTLSRAVGRQREIALRIALGAGRVRLMRQFLAESTLLALLGGGAGLILAFWITYALMGYVPTQILVPNAADHILLPRAHLDGRTLVFTLVISLLTGIVFGLVPAFQGLRCDVNDSLKEGGRGANTSGRGHRTRAMLVIIETAVAFVLVIGAGLMIKSFTQLLATNPGFHSNGILTLRLKLPDDAKNSPYREPAQRAAAFQGFLNKIEKVQGVRSAAFTEIVPLSQDDMDMSFFSIKEEPPLPPGEHLAADTRDVSPNYFVTLGIPLVQGRTFTEHDTADNPRVVIIDQMLARHFFPGQDPIGKHLQLPDSTRPEREIIGVVGAVRDRGLDQEPSATIYFPFLQSPDQTMSLVARTDLPPAAVLPAIKEAIWAVDKNQPIYNVRTMEEIVGDVTSAQRVAFLVLDVFAFLAILLAAIGIYGVAANGVSQRTNEIGIRMALGAQRSDVMRMLVRQGLRLSLWGVGIGMGTAIALTRLMSSLLFGVSATDPLTFAGVAILLSIVAMAACWIPARRATRVDPMIALRYE